MTTETISYSDEERYYKLDSMLLSSCQYLRNIFANRWKLETGEEWIDDKEHVWRFIKKSGKRAFNKAFVYQKEIMKGSKSVAEWDLSLLTDVLCNFGEGKVYKTENAALRNLKEIRKFLAHHIDKKISQDVYCDKVTVFRRSLHSLGMEEKAITSLIEGEWSTSSIEALHLLNKLFHQADVFLKNGHVDLAENCYSDAIMVPSLLPVNLGTAYEKRAAFLLQQIKNPLSDVEKCNHALLDASKAIELNDSSWMAHYLAAQCHRHKNRLSQAVHHYRRALAISPAQKQVKADLEGCRLLEETQKRDDHLNPHLMPMNLTERVAHLENETGIKMSNKEFLAFKQYGEGSLIKGQDHVFRGHQNLMGWNVPINPKEAARHYAKAAKLKNPEGMYNLAICYEYGRGVEQNVHEALRIYREVAEMDPHTIGESTPLKRNVSVAGAQHAIGLLFDGGIAVEQDYSEAAKWYRRGMENGVGQSANNLGILYASGQGVPQDMKMAELCWQQGIVLKDANAAPALMNYYMRELEPVKAKDMFRIGKEMGNHALLNLSERDFSKMAQFATYTRSKEEPAVLEFERTHQLSKKGLTFKERLYRKVHYKDQHSVKLEKMLGNLVTSNVTEPVNWGGKAQNPWTKHNMLVIEAEACQGSVTALSVLKTWEYSSALNLLLLKTEQDTATESRKSEIVDLFYSCATRELHLVTMLECNEKKLKNILAKLFEEEGETKASDDEKIRFCFVTKNLTCSMYSSDMYAVELLKEGIRRYPNNLHYYELITDVLGSKKKHQMGKMYAEKGLQLYPENANLLYSLASHLFRQGFSESDECIAKYKEFLARAPPDHRKVPEAYYQIAGSYCGQLEPSLNILATINSYYQRGLDAEQHQLPCYLPYGSSEVKCFVANLISIFKEPSGSPHVRNLASVKADESEPSVLEKKLYLKSPSRKGIITLHRKVLKASFDEDERHRKAGLPSPTGSTLPPKLQQPRIKKASALRPITLLEMNPTQDSIFQNRCLDLTIMDDPNPHYPSIHLIAEDENGDMTRVYIYNVEKTEESMQHFMAGCRIAIMNPYMRIGAQDITHGIRNDEPSNIVYLKRVESMCRFCGEGNAVQKCSKCSRPYCSRECQRLDWKILNHKLICNVRI